MARIFRRYKPGRRPSGPNRRPAVPEKKQRNRERRFMRKTVSVEEAPTRGPGLPSDKKSVTRLPTGSAGTSSVDAVGVEGIAQFPEEQIAELRRDVLAARALQLRMLPSLTPKIPGYEVTAFYDACDVLAGDFFQFVKPGDGETGFLVADVSGHGLTAAMIMAATIKTFSFYARRELSPKTVLANIYQELRDDLPKGRFITAFYAILNHSTGKLRFARAGHNPALICRGTGAAVEELMGKGMAIGLGGPEFFQQCLEENETHMPVGSSLLLYSDGLTEAHNSKGEQFGEDRLKAEFSKRAGERSRPMVEQLIQKMRAHTQSYINEDDLTLMVLKRKS